jgi:hypothetical protein
VPKMAEKHAVDLKKHSDIATKEMGTLDKRLNDRINSANKSVAEFKTQVVSDMGTVNEALKTVNKSVAEFKTQVNQQIDKTQNSNAAQVKRVQRDFNEQMSTVNQNVTNVTKMAEKCTVDLGAFGTRLEGTRQMQSKMAEKHAVDLGTVNQNVTNVTKMAEKCTVDLGTVKQNVTKMAEKHTVDLGTMGKEWARNMHELGRNVAQMKSDQRDLNEQLKSMAITMKFMDPNFLSPKGSPKERSPKGPPKGSPKERSPKGSPKHTKHAPNSIRAWAKNKMPRARRDLNEQKKPFEAEDPNFLGCSDKRFGQNPIPKGSMGKEDCKIKCSGESKYNINGYVLHTSGDKTFCFCNNQSEKRLRGSGIDPSTCDRFASGKNTYFQYYKL